MSVHGCCVCLFATEWWPLSALFIRSQSGVLSHLSLEDRSISNHNRWRCYLNNESRLKQVWQWSRDILHLTGAAVDESGSHAHTRLCTHACAHSKVNKRIHTKAGYGTSVKVEFHSVTAALSGDLNPFTVMTWYLLLWCVTYSLPVRDVK